MTIVLFMYNAVCILFYKREEIRMQQNLSGGQIDAQLVLPPEMDGESNETMYAFIRDSFMNVSSQGGNPDVEIIFGGIQNPINIIVEEASFISFPYMADEESETHFNATVFFPNYGRYNIYVYKNRKPFLERTWFFLYMHPFFGGGVFFCII